MMADFFRTSKRAQLGRQEPLESLHHSGTCLMHCRWERWSRRCPLKRELDSQFSVYHTVNARQHPHLSPTDTWRTLFDLPTEPSSPSETLKSADVKLSTEEHASFTPSKLSAPKEILRTLKENPKDTVTIVAIGPMTNLALAAAEDPETFLRVKEVVVMGGAINEPGNVGLSITYISSPC